MRRSLSATGYLLLVVLVMQVLGGALLLVYYKPTVAGAYESVGALNAEVSGGWLVRQMHAWGAQVLVVLIMVYQVRDLFLGHYRKPRELVWITGCLVAGVLLLEAYTGFVLRWDDRAYWGAVIGTEFVHKLPWIGPWISQMVRGGLHVGEATLGRFFAAHVAFLPMMLLVGGVAHGLLSGYWQVNGRSEQRGRDAPEDGVVNRPRPERAFLLLGGFYAVLILLVLLAHVWPQTLGPRADPMGVPENIKPPWYFLPVYHLMSTTSPWIAAVLSGLVLVLAIGWPFVERTDESNTTARRRLLLLAFVVLVIWAGLGVAGYVSNPLR